MAKTSKTKSNPTANPRSRAAKRATSPSIDVDKSIKEAPRASDATPILGVTRGGGVMKKQKKKNLTRGQRARQEKTLARAEAVMDQMEKKVDVSKSRSRRIQQRASRWEDVNGIAEEETRKAVRGPGREAAEEEWEDIKEADEGDIKMNVSEDAQPVILNSSVNTDLTNNATVAPLDDLDLIT